jgi:actin-related protein
MTRDGIMQDVGEKMRGLMSGDFNPEQARALFAFVHEQIREYCHSKVDQRVFEKKLDEKLQTFHTKEDQRVFESWIKGNFYTKEDQRIFEEKLDERFNALNTIFHTKEDQRIFEEKITDRFQRLENKMDKFEEKMEQQTFAIIELTKAINKSGGTL